jgi:hypothetical protein
MSTPFFLTGAVAKIKVNNKTMAYCTDISYSVEVGTVNPKILGMYESHTMEPLSYQVTGSLTVIRYVKDAKTFSSNPPKDVSATGNGIGAWGANEFLDRIGGGNDGKPNEHMNPKLLDTSPMFDIVIYQKIKVPVQEKVAPSKEITMVYKEELHAVARLRDCRIQRMDFSMSKTSAVRETYSFRAAYLDEDSFNAQISGLGHHLT